MEWLTQTVAGKIIATMVLSMVPVLELRAGLPFGIAQGLQYPIALCASIAGNMIPVPFIIIYIRKVFAYLKSHNERFGRWVTKLEARADSKGDVVRKYGPIGLLLFVAIPLPGTGAWTGALIAAIMDIRLKRAVPIIFLGLIIAALIMSVVTFGFIHIF